MVGTGERDKPREPRNESSVIRKVFQEIAVAELKERTMETVSKLAAYRIS